MALRKIRTLGDPVLEKVSKPITEVNEKIKELDHYIALKEYEEKNNK